MKRKERMQKAASEDTLIYVQEIIGSYRSMKERIVSFEKKHSSLLELSGVNMNAFLPESIPSEDLFVEPDIPPKDKEGVSRYLHEKERVYLLERGVALLEDEEIRGVARESFLEQKSRSEIGRKWCVSIATVTRRRQEAKILIAQYVDSYMKWKVEKLFY